MVNLIGLKPGILINMDVQDVEVITLRKELGTLIIPFEKHLVICNLLVVITDSI